MWHFVAWRLLLECKIFGAGTVSSYTFGGTLIKFWALSQAKYMFIIIFGIRVKCVEQREAGWNLRGSLADLVTLPWLDKSCSELVNQAKCLRMSLL